MKVNQTGLAIIKHYEGFRSKPYLCAAGVPTIGYGSTFLPFDHARVKLDTPKITREAAERVLLWELRHTCLGVKRAVRVPLTHDQFSALVSLAYNIGLGNFRASTLLRKLNRGDYIGCSNEFWKWRRAGGRILKGLVRRREHERLLFNSELECLAA